MLKLKPYNDYVLVELIEDKHGELVLANQDDLDSVQKGKVLAVSDSLYRSTGGWALDEMQTVAAISNNADTKANLIDQLKAERQELVGKTIYWEKFGDKDATFDVGNKTKHALIKIAKIVAIIEEQ